MSKNILGEEFYYPSRNLGIYWQWPWNVNVGLLYWFYRKWSVPSQDSKQIYSGRTILGFQKITVTWNCDPPEAYYIHKQKDKKMYARMYEMVEELNKISIRIFRNSVCHE